MLHKSFKPAKCKTALNLAKSRIKLMKNRKDIQVKQLKREIAQLLESKQDQSATIRVEHVIREENMMAAYEMIEIYCELIVARLPIIESQKNCPLDLKEAIASLIFAAPRCGDITELQDARKHFAAKYGKDFSSAAVELRPNSGVSRRLVEKLSVNAPDGPTKIKVLTTIAEEHNIQWEPSSPKDEDPLPSVDTLYVTKDDVGGNKIQMQPLNVEIADDFEENHERGTSFQSHTHASSDLVPPSSISHLDSRYSENNSSDKITFNQPYNNSERAFRAGRPKWNTEFKDATTAAQAAAESAELASIAARAAAELSIRSNVMSETSSVYSQSHGQGQSQKFQRAASGQQHGHVSRSSTTGSFNQRSTRMKSQRELDRQDNMTEGIDPTSSYEDYSEFRAQNERSEQDFRESKSDTRHGRDFDSSPVTQTEPNAFKSSNFSNYELESTENPFFEEPREREHRPSLFQSHSSDIGDYYGVFAGLNYDKYGDNDSGGSSFGSFSRKTVDQEVWQLRSTYSYAAEGMSLNDHREEHTVSDGEDLLKNQREGSRDLISDVNDGFQSKREIFVGMDHGVGRKDDKNIHPNDNVVFDESGSDDDYGDDKLVLNSSGEQDTFTPSKLTYKASVFNSANPQSEPDLSKSFRSSSIYSKLIEPLPVNYDSDGAGSGSEKELQVEKSDAGVASFENPDGDKPDTSRHLEFMTSSDVGKENAYALKTSTNLKENQNRYQNSEYEDGTELRPEGGMELNLGSLPGGRRNRAHWRIPRDGMAVSPITTNFSYREKPSAFESSSHRSNPRKMDGFHTNFDPPSNGNELENTLKDSDNDDGSYGAISRVSVRKTSHKDPSRYFVSDNSEPEEDVPKPVMSKTFVGAGLSRRTKASASRSKTGQTSQTSSSYSTKVSSSRNLDQSSHDYEASTFGQNLGSKASKDDRNSYSAVADNSGAQASFNVKEASSSIVKAPSRENSTKLPSHVHPKLPDFETFTAHFQSLRKNRQ